MIALSERQREILFGAGLLLAALCLAVAGEALLHVQARFGQQQGFNWRNMLKAVAFDPDAQPYPSFRPGTRYGDIAINGLGFRGPEIAAVKPPHTLRVLFLGNSVFFGPLMPERETIPAETAADMADALKGCRVEYVNASGPRFTLGYLTSLLDTRLSPAGASVAVAMGPTAREVLQVYDEMDGESAPIYREPGWLFRHSILWQRISRSRFAESRAIETSGAPRRLDPERVRQAIRRLMAGFQAAAGGNDVVIVRANSNIRAGMTPTELSVSLLADLEGVASDELVALLATIDAETAAFAEQAGWSYIDPLGALPLGKDYFSDATHPTAKGNALVARSIADTLLRQTPAPGAACP